MLSAHVVLAPNYANDAKTFLKHFSDCLFISALHVWTLGAEIK